MPPRATPRRRRIPRAPPSSNPADRADWRDREPPHQRRRPRAISPPPAAARTRRVFSWMRTIIVRQQVVVELLAEDREEVEFGGSFTCETRAPWWVSKAAGGWASRASAASGTAQSAHIGRRRRTASSCSARPSARSCRPSVALPASMASDILPPFEPLIFSPADRPCGRATHLERATRAVRPARSAVGTRSTSIGGTSHWRADGVSCNPPTVSSSEFGSCTVQY